MTHRAMFRMVRTLPLLFVAALLASIAGCDASTPAGPRSGGAVTVTKVGGDNQSALVASAVPVPPSVRVTRENGEPIPGTIVVFAVGTGGGRVQVVNSLITDSNGVAAVDAWVLGEHAGSNTLSATVLRAAPVVFLATGLAREPASMTKTEGDNQVGDVGDFLPFSPAVVVQDAFGNPVPGVTVTFSVGPSSGELFGVLQTALQDTDDTGTARVHWRLGPVAGVNSLEAEVADLPAETFTATALNRCTETIPYVVGTTASGTVPVEGCRLWNRESSDRYAVSVPEATSLEFDMESFAFSPHVSLFDASGTPLASGPHYCEPDLYCGGETSLRLLLGAGDYIVGAGVFTYDYGDDAVGGVGASYTLSSIAVPEDVGSCSGEDAVFIVPGATTTQRIQTTDCVDTYSVRSTPYNYFYDRIDLYVTAGRTYTVSMSSAEFDTYLELQGPVNYTSVGSPNSQITFTPTTSGTYVIKPGTYASETTGSYTLTSKGEDEP